MKILLINYGSSSVKFQLYEITDEKNDLLARGIVERPGTEIFILTYGIKEKIKEVLEIADSRAFIKVIVDSLTHPKYGVLKSKTEIEAVGHRVVHGGEYFSKSVLITPEVKEKIKECISFAPLHNPFNLRGIELTEETLPGVPQVAIFDTAFHSQMPPYAYIYGLPFQFYKQYGIRRYGFHGPSHYYVSHRVEDLLQIPITQLKIITCHLGNGASIAAVKNGISVDTSMGLTPLEGLIMGTRCGNIDPAIIPQIIAQEGLSTHEVYNLLNRYSGLLGISGISNDMRDIIQEMDKGSERAKLAFDIYTYTIRKYIGAYAAAMGGIDVLVFTAGVGENSPRVRKECCKDLEFLGIALDPQKNEETIGKEGIISSTYSKVKVLCIPTNEELVMALDTYKLVRQLKTGMSS